MIKEYTIGIGENPVDVALNAYGSAEGLMQLWRDNPTMELDKELIPGETLLIDESKVIDQDVVDYFVNTGKKVSTGNSNLDRIFDQTFDQTFE